MKTTKVATIAIKSPGTMSKRVRNDIAGWLRKLANQLVTNGDAYTHGRFTAGFNYVSK